MMYGEMTDKQASMLRRLLPEHEWYRIHGLNKQEASDLIGQCIARKEAEEGYLPLTARQAEILAQHGLHRRTRSEFYAAMRAIREKQEFDQQFGGLRGY